MKKIAIAISKLEQGGVSTALISLLEELAKRPEIQVDLFLLSTDNRSRFTVPEGIHVITPSSIYNIWFSRRKACKGIRKAVWYFIHFIGIKINFKMVKLLAHCKEYGAYDIAISYENDICNPEINLMCNDFVEQYVKADKKYGWIHNDAYKLGFTEQYVLNRYQNFDGIIHVSYGNKEKFDAIAPSLAERSYVVYNCINLKEKIDCETKWSAEDGKIHLISVSRIDNEQKRIDRMIESCVLLKEAGLEGKFLWHMFGSGPDEVELKSLAAEKGVDDVFLFEGQTDCPLRCMAKSDIYVMTSDYEGYGLTILEALMENLPVVVTNFAEAKESVADGKNGYLVDFDVNSISEKIGKLICDGKLRKQFYEYTRNNPVTNKVAMEQFNKLLVSEEEHK
ncbi:glycosyltransferase [[Clostridium] polysaccharolyticum]|uniref:Glycosyltransferase involved in cell wall bisynthesis n=1 Tax=[Clostridium] polysaccharolyticum TaxID=29364 RepID=A0A1H9ZE50_9FIRM|nr:glycosyltransferase [[Clostridium] polysaccharolyticum]SES79127.1 Glycosyltransferase involved in cell wall bisynthesis [[Clostridium] polysaccharolyticum]